MTTPLSTQAPTNDAPLSMRERLTAWWKRQSGWPFAAIWLVFLGFTFQAILANEIPLWQKWFAASAVVCFAAIYLRGFSQIRRDTERGTHSRNRWFYLAGMMAMLVVVGPFAQTVGFLSMATFLLPYMTFAFTWRQAIVSYVIAVLVPPICVLLTGQVYYLFFWLNFGVTASACAAGRFGEEKTVRDHRRQEAQALAQERERVARDVHDVLGHTLTVLTVKTELAEKLLDLDVDRARQELQEIRGLVRESLNDVRSTVTGLRAVNFVQEVAGARAVCESSGIELECTQDPEVLDPRWRITSAWVLRELMTNLMRHSNATTASVTWGTDWLRVVDNGDGVQGTAEGNGLRGIRERVDGSVTLSETDPGQNPPGLTVEVRYGV